MKLLFAINGLGLGNSTRCYSIMQQLVRAGVDCHVVTSGNGRRFFAGKNLIKSLHAMPALAYASREGRLSVAGTLGQIPALARALKAKARCLEQVLDTVAPDAVVVDSEYVLSPFRKRRMPVAAINNSGFLFSTFWRNVPPGARSHFWTIELADHLFHLVAPDLVLAPCPAGLVAGARLRAVGLLVRQEFLQGGTGPRAASPRDVRQALYVPGGSELSNGLRLALDALPFPVRRLSTDLEAHVGEMMAADFLIVGGGWSSISEAMALAKPVVAIPLPGHSEQHFNARLLERWGFGQCLSPDTLVPSLLSQWEQGCWWRSSQTTRPELTFDGAEQACRLLLEWLERKGSVPERAARV